MQGVYGKCVTQRHWFFWWAGATNLTVIGDYTKKALVHGGSTHYYNAALMHQRVKYARHVPKDVRRLFCQGYLRVWILFLQGGKPTRLIMTFVSGKGRRALQWFVSTTILWVPLTLLFHNSSFTRLKCVSPCFCHWRLLYVKHSYQNNWCQLSAAIDDTHLSHSVAITLHYSTQLSTPVCVAQSNISRVACSPWWTHWVSLVTWLSSSSALMSLRGAVCYSTLHRRPLFETTWLPTMTLLKFAISCQVTTVQSFTWNGPSSLRVCQLHKPVPSLSRGWYVYVCVE